MSILWRPLSFADRMKVLIAMIMVKMGKLKYDQFTEQELNDLIVPYFPQTLDIPVPIGKGQLTLLEGEISMPQSTNRIQLQLLCGLEIRVLANPIYRAHLVVIVSADPHYLSQHVTLTIENIRVDEVALINDEYALLSDTSKIIDSLSPVQLSGLLATPMKSALNILTAGTSNQAINYLQLYIGGSKQKILDYHRPQIENHVIQAIAENNLTFTLDPAEWRQNLFSRLGKHVVVEQSELRFYF
ncbi:DUF1439 domain-containing protein [Alteromonas sp. ASW11-36]|uniref:DUF1439 domain-containing protein n=1 Tax=Alteromonas arenosi TaxID=3055817 RepID=A0ABT7SVT2_9ALTE|nr:DUF1439 domain-containing protein [Alteromonas sp. ASW11-36]MDM7860306.1 DUF1439 domain-containing protein [Alteromonas sp. ASW11-36]